MMVGLFHLFVTAAMFGIIWLVQLVQYPIFAGLDRVEFQKWHRFHTKRISWIVAPLMIAELSLVSVWLFQVFSNSGGSVVGESAVVGSVALADSALRISVAFMWFLTVMMWGATFLISVPLHAKLEASGYDFVTIQKLTRTNWIRTMIYSIKIMVVLYVAL